VKLPPTLTDRPRGGPQGYGQILASQVRARRALALDLVDEQLLDLT
jgi:hypothetical protein